jgi:hypothetical protein
MIKRDMKILIIFNHASTSLTVVFVNWKLRPPTLLALMNALHSNCKADGARVHDKEINTNNATLSVPLISRQTGVLITWTVATVDVCGSNGEKDLGNLFLDGSLTNRA